MMVIIMLISPDMHDMLYLLNTMTLADVSNCMLTLLPSDSLTLLHAFSSNCTTLVSCLYCERSRLMCHHIGLFKTTRLIVSHQVWEQAVNGKDENYKMDANSVFILVRMRHQHKSKTLS